MADIQQTSAVKQGIIIINPGKLLLGVTLVSSTLTVMAGSIIAPVLNLMGEGLGVEPSSARFIITTHGILIALCSPLIGVLIDRFGVRRPLGLGLFVYGLAGGSGLFITNYWLLIVSRIIFGIGVAAVFTSVTVVILNLYEGSRRNKIMGWRSSCNSMGGFTWPLLGGFLGTFSWQLPFAVYLVGIPLSILVLLTMPQTQTRVVQQGNTSTREESVLGLFKKTPLLFIIYGIFFLTNVLLYVIVVFVPKFVAELGTTNPFYIGILISTSSLAAGITSLSYGRIRAKLSYKKMILTALALWVAGFITMSQAFTVLVLGVSIAVFGIGLGIAAPAALVWAGESVHASFRGRISSYLPTFGFIGQFLSPIILSPVESSLGLNMVFVVAGGVCALLLVLLLFTRMNSLKSSCIAIN